MTFKLKPEGQHFEIGHFRQHVKRPGGKKESGVFKELEEGQCAENTGNRGECAPHEASEVDLGQLI